MKLKYKLGLVIIGVMIIMCFMTFQSYALFVANLSGNENSLDVGCFKIEFTESSSSIALSNTYPMNDTKGLTITPYTFTITNKCTNDASYSVILSSLTTNGIDDSNIKYAIYETTKPSTGTLLTSATTYTDTYNLANVKNRKNSYQVATGGLKGATEENGTGGSKTYNLILWLDEATGNDAMNKTFNANINIVSVSHEPQNIADSIKVIASTSSDLENDEFGNTRYIGKDPNNYINVDGDIWRIIGVMKDIDDGTGTKEDRVKIIRASSIGQYSWDTSDSSVNGGWGINEWSQADLMKLLNPGYEIETVGGSLYWNSKTGNCYNGTNNATTTCDFTSTGINDKMKTLIGDAIWNTGTASNISINLRASYFYQYERQDVNGKICASGSYCNDAITRTTAWTGKVGLIHSSDYEYASNGSSTINRETCLKSELISGSIQDNILESCMSNNWIKADLFTITPAVSDRNATYIFYIDSIFGLNNGSSYELEPVFPTAYLKSSVKIASGTGSSSDPFILEE